MPYPEQIQGIKEMSRVLKKNGRLLITYDHDKGREGLTETFVKASGMTPTELVYFRKPDNLYPCREPQPDVVGICLIK
jgi:ubiquinone/menaquinone biosynthesis C-methylase UbiE